MMILSETLLLFVDFVDDDYCSETFILLVFVDDGYCSETLILLVFC